MALIPLDLRSDRTKQEGTVVAVSEEDATAPDQAERRARMVRRDIEGRGIRSRRVIDAMATVPRERFVPSHLAPRAYEDGPLPIGGGQTISQPYIVGLMIDEAQVTEHDRVLEVGTGSGYGAAVLSRVAEQVWTIERLPALAENARTVLADLGYDNVTPVVGDGSLGWPDAAPYDAIIVTAGGVRVPQPLVDQLADGGRLIIPVGPEAGSQQLLCIRREGEDIIEEDLGPVAFVPLVEG